MTKSYFQRGRVETTNQAMVGSSSMPHLPTAYAQQGSAGSFGIGERCSNHAASGVLRVDCVWDGPMGIPTDVWGFKHAKTILKPW